jgi:peptidoglycan/LPS O-acetylase OafA/YrhL
MKDPNKTFYPQLDSLRAIAVILVIISHWFSAEYFLNRYTNNGTLGVTLFFVLSGFLITGILLRNKMQIEEGSSVKQAYKIFYIRRSLRIFPVYYLLLFVLLIFNMAAIRESFWWHVCYGSNFYFWIQGKFEGQLSHFWSLSVEEQFYLLWPAVIFFISRKYLQPVLLIGIAGAILFRYFITTPQNDTGRILMPGSLDSFCIGGLMAYGRQFASGWYTWYLKKRGYFLFLALLVLIFVHTEIFRNLGPYVVVCWYYLLISFAFGLLIDRVADTINFRPVRWVLSNKVLLYIGKISYGIYLFHNFIPYFYGINFPGILQSFSFYIIQCLRFLLLIAIASLSWYVYEKPILKLKGKFSYR